MLIDGLEKHEIDIALAYEVHERPGLLRVPLVQEETLFVSARGAEPLAAPSPRRGGRRGAARTAASAAAAAAVSAPASAATATPGGGAPSLEFAELARYALVMPGPRDGVRQQVLATAKRLALPLQVILDVSSVSMMKNMVASGDAAAVMPYGNVADDIAQGRLVGRRIVNPPLTRTLYLVRPLRRAQFKYESEVLELLASATRDFAQRLGVLATPLEALVPGSLAGAMAALQG